MSIVRARWDRTAVGLLAGAAIAVVLIAVLGVLAVGLGTLTGNGNFFVFGFGILLIGVTQLLVVIPLFIWAMRRQASHFARGLVIAAGIVFLLNVGCWALLATTDVFG